MIQELLYTSAPKGLKPGSRGFCTVLSTSGMPAPVATTLESLSGYRPVFPPGHPDVLENPVVYSHLRMSLAGIPSHVLSRVSDYGLDYSQRSNKIAHHLVIPSGQFPVAGPAWVLASSGLMRSSWDGEPRIVSGERTLPDKDHPPVICSAWKAQTGDAGWAGVLAESFLENPDQAAYVVFRPGMNPLPLIDEAMRLLPLDRRWDVTFSTYFTRVPNGVSCLWRCVLADSPEAKESRRYVHALRIDLTQPLPLAKGGKLVEIARKGASSSFEFSLKPEVEAPRVVIEKRELPTSRIQTDDRPIEILKDDSFPPQISTPRPRLKKKSRSSGSRLSVWKVLMVVLWLGGAVGLITYLIRSVQTPSPPEQGIVSTDALSTGLEASENDPGLTKSADAVSSSEQDSETDWNNSAEASRVAPVERDVPEQPFEEKVTKQVEIENPALPLLIYLQELAEHDENGSEFLEIPVSVHEKPTIRVGYLGRINAEFNFQDDVIKFKGPLDWYDLLKIDLAESDQTLRVTKKNLNIPESELNPLFCEIDYLPSDGASRNNLYLQFVSPPDVQISSDSGGNPAYLKLVPETELLHSLNEQRTALPGADDLFRVSHAALKFPGEPSSLVEVADWVSDKTNRRNRKQLFAVKAPNEIDFSELIMDRVGRSARVVLSRKRIEEVRKKMKFAVRVSVNSEMLPEADRAGSGQSELRIAVALASEAVDRMVDFAANEVIQQMDQSYPRLVEQPVESSDKKTKPKFIEKKWTADFTARKGLRQLIEDLKVRDGKNFVKGVPGSDYVQSLEEFADSIGELEEDLKHLSLNSIVIEKKCQLIEGGDIWVPVIVHPRHLPASTDFNNEQAEGNG